MTAEGEWAVLGGLNVDIMMLAAGVARLNTPPHIEVMSQEEIKLILAVVISFTH